MCKCICYLDKFKINIFENKNTKKNMKKNNYYIFFTYSFIVLGFFITIIYSIKYYQFSLYYYKICLSNTTSYICDKSDYLLFTVLYFGILFAFFTLLYRIFNSILYFLDYCNCINRKNVSNDFYDNDTNHCDSDLPIDDLSIIEVFPNPNLTDLKDISSQIAPPENVSDTLSDTISETYDNELEYNDVVINT